MPTSGHAGLRLVACASTHEAVQGVDIITTVTADKTNATIITPDMLAPGMHINGVGGGRARPGCTPTCARGSVFVDTSRSRASRGDCQQMPADFPVVELWRVLAGQHGGPPTATRSRSSIRWALPWKTSRRCA